MLPEERDRGTLLDMLEHRPGIVATDLKAG